MLVDNMSNKGITELQNSLKLDHLQNHDHQAIIYHKSRQEGISANRGDSAPLNSSSSNYSNPTYYTDSIMFETAGTTRNLVLPLPGIHSTGNQELPSLTSTSNPAASSNSSLVGFNTQPQYPVSSPQYGLTSNGSYSFSTNMAPNLPATPTSGPVPSDTSVNQLKSQMPSRLPKLPQSSQSPPVTSAASNGRVEGSVCVPTNDAPLGTTTNKPMAYIAVNAVDPPLKTEDGKFKCRTCGRLYAQLKHLKRHAIMHTGINPYGCDYCKKRFTRPDICKRHMSTCPVKKNMFEGRYYGGAVNDTLPAAGTPSKRVKLDFPFESPPNNMYSAKTAGNGSLDNGYPMYSGTVPLSTRQNAGLMATNYGTAQRVPVQMNQSPIEHYDYSHAAGQQPYNQSYYYYPQVANPAAYSPVYTGPPQPTTNLSSMSPAQQQTAQQYFYQQTGYAQQHQPVLAPISAPQTPPSTVTSSPPPPGTVAGLGIYLQK